MRVGIDFGLTITDAVLLDEREERAHTALLRPGPASPEVLRRALDALGAERAHLEAIAVTGGRSRDLPRALDGVPIVVVDEPTAIGRGGLSLARRERALVVSCGTGTAMISADATTSEYRHVTGTPVGGGTLEGLAARLVGVGDALAVLELAARGSAAAVDTTLGDVLGGGVGALPPTATAVSFGRLSTARDDAAPEDLAAGLVTMVAQTIALIALNAARAEGLSDAVCVGRLAGAAPIRTMIEAVFRVYGAAAPIVPDGGARATALGAAEALP